jgi:hypothetical protein
MNSSSSGSSALPGGSGEEVDVIAEAVELYEEKTQAVGGRSFLLFVANLGRSQEGNVSERDEEILAREVDPLWARPRTK